MYELQYIDLARWDAYSFACLISVALPCCHTPLLPPSHEAKAMLPNLAPALLISLLFAPTLVTLPFSSPPFSSPPFPAPPWPLAGGKGEPGSRFPGCLSNPSCHQTGHWIAVSVTHSMPPHQLSSSALLPDTPDAEPGLGGIDISSDVVRARQPPPSIWDCLVSCHNRLGQRLARKRVSTPLSSYFSPYLFTFYVI